MAERNRNQAERTREKILSVALVCFAKNGYSETSCDEIASRLRMTKGAIFWHFKSKEDILAELLVRESRTYRPLERLAEAETVDDVRDVFLAWAERMAANRSYRRFMRLILCRVSWSDTLRAKFRRRIENGLVTDGYAIVVETMARLRQAGRIETPLSDEQIASLLGAVFFGLHREAWLHKRSIDLIQTVRAGLDVILQGIRRN